MKIFIFLMIILLIFCVLVINKNNYKNELIYKNCKKNNKNKKNKKNNRCSKDISLFGSSICMCKNNKQGRLINNNRVCNCKESILGNILHN